MLRRKVQYTKVITSRFRTVRHLLTAASLAVFFSTAAPASDSSLFSLEAGMSDLVYRISRSIVTVEASASNARDNAVGGDRDVVRRLVSSGLVCDSSGHILVAAPMVAGRDRISVIFDGRPIPAELLGIDYHTNLALIRSIQPLGEPIDLSTKRACAGHMVVAMGNSYGLRAAPSLGFCAGVRVDGLMQFSVPISSGTIGGGVFDMTGQLLGVIIDGAGEDSRIALAVPGFQLPSIISYLETRGDRHAGFLGVQSADIEIIPPLEITTPQRLASAEQGDRMILERGVIVTAVLPKSPADNGGIVAGDLVIGFDDIHYSSAAELAQAVRCSRPGKVVTVEVIRQNRSITRAVQIGRKRLDQSSLADPGRRAETPDIDVDSLTNAINTLKQQLESLESQVSSLKR
ncbi:PDZ domain-containing protein [candidate division GN15 bacterium]|nr:PDZ domain-containing protein [candidate division GN15 bacterium]